MKQISQIVFLLSLFITCLSHAMLTELHCAALDGNLKCVQHLLNAGADVNAVDEGGCTPLHVAAERGYEAVVNLLLEKGASIECNG